MEQNMINYLGILFLVFGTAGVQGCTVCQEQGDCKLLSGLFMKGSLTPGYNDITELPKGACAINITIIRPSSNRLALGLEGEGGLFINPVENASTPTGFYHSAGISFYYYRGDTLSREQIIAEGPLPKPLKLKLFVSEVNKGVEYRYMYPVSKDKQKKEEDAYNPYAEDAYKQNSENAYNTQYAENKPSKSRHNSFDDFKEQRFSWSLKMLTSCSRSCAGGFQSTVAVCIKTRQNKVVSDSKCRRRDKPSAQVVPCNRNPCPPVWSPGPWAPCSRSCDEGVQERQVRCEQELSPNLRITAPESVCSQRSSRLHIVTTRKCFLGSCTSDSKRSQFEDEEINRSSRYKNSSSLDRRSASVGGSTQTVGGSTNHQPWLSSGSTVANGWTSQPGDSRNRVPDYPRQKQNQYGTSTYPRQWTKGPPPPPERGIQGAQRPHGPVQGRTAGPGDKWMEVDSLTEWVAQPWAPCSVTCAQGVKERRVHCVDKRGGLVPDSRCETLSRPESEGFCDMGPCPINQWLSGPWDVCTAHCGEGKQYRDVYCSGDCTETDRPEASRPCNASKPCRGHWVTGRWSICSRSCGHGYQKRDVLCVHADNSTDLNGNSNKNICPMKKRPRQRRQCEIQACKPVWVTSNWTKCSVSCGTGVQTRHVVCLDRSQMSSFCSQSSKPHNSKECLANCTETRLESDFELAEDLYNDDNSDDITEYEYDDYDQILDEPEGRDVVSLDTDENDDEMGDIISKKLDSIIATRLKTNEVTSNEDLTKVANNAAKVENVDGSKVANVSTVKAAAVTCEDKFKNCGIVEQSDLCKYNFYQINCCKSCTLNLP